MKYNKYIITIAAFAAVNFLTTATFASVELRIADYASGPTYANIYRPSAVSSSHQYTPGCPYKWRINGKVSFDLRDITLGTSTAEIDVYYIWRVKMDGSIRDQGTIVGSDKIVWSDWFYPADSILQSTVETNNIDAPEEYGESFTMTIENSISLSPLWSQGLFGDSDTTTGTTEDDPDE